MLTLLSPKAALAVPRLLAVCSMAVALLAATLGASSAFLSAGLAHIRNVKDAVANKAWFNELLMNLIQSLLINRRLKVTIQVFPQNGKIIKGKTIRSLFCV